MTENTAAKRRKPRTTRRLVAKDGCRKPMYLFDRARLSVMMLLAIGALTWSSVANNPLITASEAFALTLASRPWLSIALGVELVRQLHYLVCENVPGYNKVFVSAFAWVNRRIGRVPEYTRFRIGRGARMLFMLTLISVVLGAAFGVPAATALFTLPARLISALPLLLQLSIMLMSSAVYIFAMLYFISRGDTQIYMPDEVKTRFSDVFGQDHVVEKVKEVLDLLDRPEEIEDMGGHVPGGILLWGPPGTGKTLIAEAVAGETGKPFMFVGPGSFQSPFVGGGILTVKLLFRKARKLAIRYGGVVLFFDEADSLGNRGALPGGEGGLRNGFTLADVTGSSLGCGSAGLFSSVSREALVESRTRWGVPAPVTEPSRIMMPGGMNMGQLQALLTELQGMNRPRGFMNRRVRRFLGLPPRPPYKYRILSILATNMANTLDPALLRPGRIDRQFRVGYPSLEGRITTYRKYLEKASHELSDEEIARFARLTPSASGAVVKDVVNEALLIARREGRTKVRFNDMIRARHFKELGPSDGSSYVDRERHAVAVHEACHAVTAYRTRRHRSIDLATIERGADYLGAVFSNNPEDLVTQWRDDFESDIMVAIASHVGERMFFGNRNSSGVSSDLEMATRLATLMEHEWGMGSDAMSMRGMPTDPAKTASPEKVRETLARLHQETEQLLAADRHFVLSLAHALEKHRTLTGDDIDAIARGIEGTLVDGAVYTTEEARDILEQYHAEASAALREHRSEPLTLPEIGPAS